MLCLVGSKGNMGRRYTSILQSLGVSFVGVDAGDTIPKADKYLVVTPTQSHIHNIYALKAINEEAKILCEKPISKDIDHFKVIPREFWPDIFMVNQYAYYPGIKTLSLKTGETTYDFYNSGQDGIAWDCIQLIHLAYNKSLINLSNKSPDWRARINGVQLEKSKIDACYVDMLKDFVYDSRGYLWDLKKAYKAHLDVIDFLEEKNAG